MEMRDAAGENQLCACDVENMRWFDGLAGSFYNGLRKNTRDFCELIFIYICFKV